MKKASELISTFYQQLNIQDSKGYGNFFSSWDSIVGFDLCGHCQPGNLKKGMLVIRVDHPGWHQKFLLSEKRILRDLKAKFPSLGIERLVYEYCDQLERPTALKTEEIDQEEPTPILEEKVSTLAPDLPMELKSSLSRLEKLLAVRDKERSTD